MENGIFNAGEGAPEVKAWEQRQEEFLNQYNRQPESNNESLEKIGEVIDEEKPKIGMGANDLMTETAVASDEEIRESNKILDSYGSIAVNKLAGRGADPVTDNKVVDDLVENMKRAEKELDKTGDIFGFFNGFEKIRKFYQIGAEAKEDSEVAG